VKRLYVLAGIAALQIILGSFTILGAAQPVRMSQDILVPSGTYYLYEFGILGSGRVSGNLSELQGQPFDLFVFDDAGFASFRGGSNTVAPLFEANGTTIVFGLSLPGSGGYHVVAVNLPAKQELQIHLSLVVVGLKTDEAIVAVIVLVGGLALLGASLMLSVWAWRRGPAAAVPSADPPSDSPMDGPADPIPDPQGAPPNPSDDNTRIY
jgi:hypothetical protein